MRPGMLLRAGDRTAPEPWSAVPARHAAASRPGDGLVRAGALVFALGLLATVLAVVPAVASGRAAPIGLVVAAGSLLPLGFAIALVGLLRGARTNRRQARRR